jgi:hypothetical protein
MGLLNAGRRGGRSVGDIRLTADFDQGAQQRPAGLYDFGVANWRWFAQGWWSAQGRKAG